jgi:rRNA maturation RNase YbeY
MTLPGGPDFWPSEYPEAPLALYSEWDSYTPPPAESYLPWIEAVLRQEKADLIRIQFIFCSDAYLHQLNLTYLDHDTLTDVITFPYQVPPRIEGDIFISVERVRENAARLLVPDQEELDRVMIHGVLHLCGYSDQSPEEKREMTRKENEALSLRESPGLS